jgi:hypothetical protein
MSDAMRRSLAIFGLTGVAAFGVNAAGHAWMLWRGHPLVRQYRATLAYRSALIGDSLLLPLVNVLLDRQLDAWGDGLRPGCLRWSRLARALLVGTGLTALLHGYQGAQKLTNWTMPRPWRWNALGYYHAVYMVGQLTLLAYVGSAAGTRLRDEGSSALLTRRLLAVATLLTAFGVLLYKDYY